MSIDGPFKLDHKSRDGKAIFITGPHEIYLELDRDDVQTEVIDALVPLLIYALNLGWPTRVADTTVKRIHEKIDQEQGR